MPVQAATAQAAVPAFVQQASARGKGARRAVRLPSAVPAGDRLVVEIGVWNSQNAVATGVTDSAGNTYTRLIQRVASDGTELSVWSAPVTAGTPTAPTVTATVSSSADVGVAVVDYSGLSVAAGASVVDRSVVATGTTSGPGVVNSGPTPPTTAGHELAVGFYVDSGFGKSLTAGSGFTPRVNVSPTSDMEFMIEDQVVGQGAQPNAGVRTGATVPWLMATIVFTSTDG